MTILVDYNLDGYAFIFIGILTKLGWLEFTSVQFVTFREVGLSMESSDTYGKLPLTRSLALCSRPSDDDPYC
jgi:hypothetical protein